MYINLYVPTANAHHLTDFDQNLHRYSQGEGIVLTRFYNLPGPKHRFCIPHPGKRTQTDSWIINRLGRLAHERGLAGFPNP